MLKRISIKKEYKVEFYRNGICVAIAQTKPNESRFDSFLEICKKQNFYPDEMKVTDIETNEFVIYCLHMENYFPHDKLLIK